MLGRFEGHQTLTTFIAGTDIMTCHDSVGDGCPAVTKKVAGSILSGECMSMIPPSIVELITTIQ